MMVPDVKRFNNGFKAGRAWNRPVTMKLKGCRGEEGAMSRDWQHVSGSIGTWTFILAEDLKTLNKHEPLKRTTTN